MRTGRATEGRAANRGGVPKSRGPALPLAQPQRIPLPAPSGGTAGPLRSALRRAIDLDDEVVLTLDDIHLQVRGPVLIVARRHVLRQGGFRGRLRVGSLGLEADAMLSLRGAAARFDIA